MTTAKRTTAHHLLPAVAAGVIALALSGCGEEPKPKPVVTTPPPAPAPAPVAKAAPAPEPAKPAPAVRGPSEKWEANFRAADKNYDGGLSKTELDQTKQFSGIRKRFDAMDTNRDGKVTIAERQAWFAKRAARKKKNG